MDKICPGEVQAGVENTFTFNVSNNGNATAANVRLTDTLPPGGSFLSASCGAIVCSGPFPGASLTCSLGDLLMTKE